MFALAGAAARGLRRDRAALQGAARPALDLPRPLADARRTSACSSSARACSRCSSSTRSTSSACSATARSRPGSPSCRSRPGSWSPPASRRGSRRRVGVRPVAIVGMIVTIAGMLLLTRISVDGTYVVDVLPALVLTALGLGAVFVPLTLIATTGLDNDDQGLASGIFNTSQQIGGALGLAILASLAASTTRNATGVSHQEALVQGLPRRVRGRSGVHGHRARAVPSDAAAQGRRARSRPRRPRRRPPDSASPGHDPRMPSCAARAAASVRVAGLELAQDRRDVVVDRPAPRARAARRCGRCAGPARRARAPRARVRSGRRGSAASTRAGRGSGRARRAPAAAAPRRVAAGRAPSRCSSARLRRSAVSSLLSSSASAAS